MVMRPFTVIGAGQRADMALSQWVAQALDGPITRSPTWPAVMACLASCRAARNLDTVVGAIATELVRARPPTSGAAVA